MDQKYVAIHTINDDNNFGNRLQNFALQKVISDHGIPVKTLQDSMGQKSKYYGMWAEIRYLPGLVHLRALKKSISNQDSSFRNELLKQKRQALFQSFTKKYVPKFSNGLVDSKKIRKVVIGSDQIWNPYFRNNLVEDISLPDLPVEKFSYAASIGISDIDEKYDEIFKLGIEKLQAVSVRENSAKKYLNNLSNKNVEVVLDPTMLLEKQIWTQVADLSTVTINDGYVVTYFLGTPSSKQLDYIYKYATKRNLNVVNLNDVNSKLFSSIGPLEFIKIIRDSETVFADSFHAAIFSIIFEKNFELFNRQDNSIVRDMNTRMKTLFEVFNLESRLHSGEVNEEMDVVDFRDIRNILENERNRSLNWLLSALGD